MALTWAEDSLGYSAPWTERSCRSCERVYEGLGWKQRGHGVAQALLVSERVNRLFSISVTYE